MSASSKILWRSTVRSGTYCTPRDHSISSKASHQTTARMPRMAPRTTSSASLGGFTRSRVTLLGAVVLNCAANLCLCYSGCSRKTLSIQFLYCVYTLLTFNQSRSKHCVPSIISILRTDLCARVISHFTVFKRP